MTKVELHPHARLRLGERGTTEDEIVETVLSGERFPAKFGRVGFRRQFVYGGMWRGRRFANKEVEAIAVPISGGWLVLTVITRFSEDEDEADIRSGAQHRLFALASARD